MTRLDEVYKVFEKDKEYLFSDIIVATKGSGKEVRLHLANLIRLKKVSVELPVISSRVVSAIPQEKWIYKKINNQ